MPYFNNLKPDLREKLISACCYPSCGIVGLIYLLISGKDSRRAPFFYFHFLQSIILGVFSFLFNLAAVAVKNVLVGFIALILAFIPGAQTMAAATSSIVDGLILLLNGLVYLLMVYGLIFALLGKYAEIPVISSLVRRNAR